MSFKLPIFLSVLSMSSWCSLSLSRIVSRSHFLCSCWYCMSLCCITDCRRRTYNTHNTTTYLYRSQYLTYPPLPLCSVPASIMTCQCFWSSVISVVIRFLSPGFAISALVCLNFAFHLPSSAISFSWPQPYLAFAPVQTNSASSL